MPPAVTENEDMLYLRVTWRTQEERFNVTHPKFKTKKMSVLPTPKKNQNIVVFFDTLVIGMGLFSSYYFQWDLYIPVFFILLL